MTVDPDLALRYFEFIEERHRIWGKRLAGVPGPWTDDPILANRKFTNVFRVLDPGSQFVVTELMSDEPSELDALLRAFMYRFTNDPEPWRYVRRELGRWPTADDIVGGQHSLIADLLYHARHHEGIRVFSPAYITQPVANNVVGQEKARAVVDLAWRAIHPDGSETVWPEYEAATSLAERFAAVRRPNRMGSFLAQQVMTDMGYTGMYADEENDFVATGPGSIIGAAFLLGTPLCKSSPQRPLGSPAEAERRTLETIRWAQSSLLRMPGCPRLVLSDGRERLPSLMDVQNTLCEWSKYSRLLAAGGQPSRTYRPAHPGPQPEPVFPAHW